MNATLPSVQSIASGLAGRPLEAAGQWVAVLPVPPWALAVMVSVGASAFTVTGFVLQKKALQDVSGQKWPRVGDIVLSPGWILGFLVTAIFPVLGDLVAYSLAPLSLTTPLSGVSVVLNMVIAPWALNEQLQRFPDAYATFLILCGCILTTTFGDHDRTGPYVMSDLIHLATQPVFAVCVLIGAGCELLVLLQMRRNRLEMERLAAERKENPYLPHVVLPALAAALCGAVANIGLKGVGELVKAQGQWYQVVACVLVVAPAAIAQVNFINRGLFLYPQSIFLSVYSALLVLANTIYGALFYEEYRSLLGSTAHFLFFVFGCYIIVQGIWLFKLRAPGKVPEDAEELTGLLDMTNGQHDKTRKVEEDGEDGKSMGLVPRARNTWSSDPDNSDCL